jgi:hypothetical protein
MIRIKSKGRKVKSMNRRTFLAVASSLTVGSIAGCSSDGNTSDLTDTSEPTDTPTESQTATATETPTATPTPTPTATATAKPDQDGDGVPDSEDVFPEDPNLSTLVDENEQTVDVPEDDYKLWPIEISEEGTVGYEAFVRSGPEIDFFLVTEAEAREYESGNNFQYLDGTRQGVLKAEATVTLDAGVYYIIADNSEAGETSPPTNLDDDVAEVEMQIVIAR